MIHYSKLLLKGKKNTLTAEENILWNQVMDNNFFIKLSLLYEEKNLIN